MRHLTHSDVYRAAQTVADIIREAHPSARKIWGVPRGGVSAAYAIAGCSDVLTVVETPREADVIVDDLIDSGATVRHYQDVIAPEKPFAALFVKRRFTNVDDRDIYGTIAQDDDWLVFPWEGSAIGSGEDIVTRLLQYIGEDPSRGGLKETPARVLKAWAEWTDGYAQEPKNVLKHFQDGAERYDEMVLVRDIPVYSHCEHHLAPFFGVAHVAYIPEGRIVGLSKISRLVDIYAHRLQVQERLTSQIGDALSEHLKPKGVGVVLECRHLCMESRGIARQGALTVTSAMTGVMLTKPEARAEFLSLVRHA